MNKQYEITLKERQFQYLTEMAQQHGLADESKALRCLLNHAMEKQGEAAEIFEQIRCLDC